MELDLQLKNITKLFIGAWGKIYLPHFYFPVLMLQTGF